MSHVSDRIGRGKTRGFVVGVGLICVCCLRGLSAQAQLTTASVQATGAHSTSRLLNPQEGRAIADAVEGENQLASGTQDCSHAVHQIYASAGFEYPYASSFEIYAGDQNFQRVKTPQAGDLIVWPGHLGIVLDPADHTFYSLVSTGLKAQDYQGPYWKSRGRPRFYRYRIGNPAILRATGAPAAGKAANTAEQPGAATVVEERSSIANSAWNRLPEAVSERTPVIYGPPAPPALANTPSAFEVPSSIIIAAGNKAPTRNDVAEGISELSNAAGMVLLTDDPGKLALPVLIVERFSVETVEIKRDHGWARLKIDSNVSVAGGEARVKQRREKIRWELRRTASGWEAVAPSDRTYVPKDVAVKNLAARLARVTAGDGAATQQETALRQESQLVNLLSALLESK